MNSRVYAQGCAPVDARTVTNFTSTQRQPFPTLNSMDEHTNTPDDTYNGWRNRETWAAALHLSNDERLYLECVEMCRDGAARGADRIERFVTANVETALNPEPGDPIVGLQWVRSMISDVGSFWRVDWRAVAESFVEDVEAQPVHRFVNEATDIVAAHLASTPAVHEWLLDVVAAKGPADAADELEGFVAEAVTVAGKMPSEPGLRWVDAMLEDLGREGEHLVDVDYYGITEAVYDGAKLPTRNPTEREQRMARIELLIDERTKLAQHAEREDRYADASVEWATVASLYARLSGLRGTAAQRAQAAEAGDAS